MFEYPLEKNEEGSAHAQVFIAPFPEMRQGEEQTVTLFQ